ncbi:ABC transporter permease protein [Caldisalinibacter kiritimatiensis]|uniref:ABC transporter permease protein n=1 Tax=Caldisalinibacter kiritimatiensis TaxID=1304284 RepID=R1AUH1_9FIRM|nr:ABC transporter permease protein [Caldisalinibacter kiritimatiensis]
MYSLTDDVLKGDMIFQTLYSLSLILKGLIIGLLIAIILSGLSMQSKVFEGLVETIISIAHPLPGIALLPLVILWLGIGEKAIIFIIVHSVLWPLILNLLTGFKSIPKIYRQIGKNCGLNTLGVIRHILIPASLPYFITGLKIGWARAWRAVISAEMVFGAVGGTGGLGWFIFKKRVFMDSPGLFGGLIVIIFIGIVVEDLLFDRIEKMTIRKWGMTI